MGYFRHAVTCALALSLPACITTSGQSPAETKAALQATFLYRSAAAFDSGSGSGPFNATDRLTDAQKRYIESEYQKIADHVLKTYAKHRHALVQSFGALPAAPKAQPRISMPDAGYDAPRISADGHIFIDIRIARLMFRDAVLASMRSGSLGSATFMAASGSRCSRSAPDTDLLQCFLDLKQRIDNLEEQGMFSAFADRRTWKLDERSPMFDSMDLQLKSIDLAARYQGVLLFVTAHEVAHVVLGHLELHQQRKGFLTAAERREAEQKADDFAVTLLSLATPELALFGGSGLGSYATGFEGFFRHTYKNAQWSDDGPSHPPSTERLARARSLHEQIRGRQANEIFQLIEQRLADAASKGGGRD